MSRTSRILPILNLVGCILITSLILAQWLKERKLDQRIETLTQELSDSQAQYESEKKRAESLDRDVLQLKESIESAAATKKELEDTLAKLTAEQNAAVTQANTVISETNTAIQDQVKVWEKAIADRDSRIRALNENLVATRQKLNEAIGELKKAGAH
ncbi:MAG: hypothetical protein QM680_05895 [Luteolibacter sp.]